MTRSARNMVRNTGKPLLTIFSEIGRGFHSSFCAHLCAHPAQRFLSAFPPYRNVAGEEKGLVASTTNITTACKSVQPLLETCSGVLPPGPASA